MRTQGAFSSFQGVATRQKAPPKINREEAKSANNRLGRCSSINRFDPKGAAQSAGAKNNGIQLFEIPEFGEVESDRRRIDKASVFDALDEAPNSALERFSGSGDLAAVEQGAYRQSSLFDARRGLRSASPTAVIALSPDEPVKSTPRGLSLDQIQSPIGGQDSRGPICRVFFFGSVLVAEPERNPGAVGTLRATQKSQAALDCAFHPSRIRFSLSRGCKRGGVKVLLPRGERA